MKNRILIFACMAVAVLLWIPGCDDIRFDLQLTLDQWNEADRTRNGAAYAALLDPQDLENYDRILTIARSGTREQIRRLPPTEKFDVTYLRATLTGAQLRNLNTPGVIASTVSPFEETGRRPSIMIGRIERRPPRAHAELIIDGIPTKDMLEFVKVEDKWLISERAFHRWFDELVAERARRIDRSEDFVILQLVRDLSGKRFDDRIWDAPPR